MRPRFRCALGCIVLGLVIAAGCERATRAKSTPSSGKGTTSPGIRFVDVAARAGVQFGHTSGRSGRLYLPETMGSGCAFLDYDGDGRLDLFFVNGSRLPGFREKGPFYPALYRNRGDGAFEDVTRRAGLTV